MADEQQQEQSGGSLLRTLGGVLGSMIGYTIAAKAGRAAMGMLNRTAGRTLGTLLRSQKVQRFFNDVKEGSRIPIIPARARQGIKNFVEKLRDPYDLARKKQIRESIKHQKEAGNFLARAITELKVFCFPWQKAKIFIRN